MNDAQKQKILEDHLLRGEIERFIIYEVALLDDRKFEEWMALFDDDGRYWAPTTICQDSPLNQVSIFFDDKTLMTQRINRLRHERIHSQAPHSRTLHLVSNIKIVPEQSSESGFCARANFIMVEFRPSVPEGVQRVFAGVYEYDLRRVQDTFIVKSKKATLINCDSTFSPLALYF
ncbi:MAG TPA: aromatic-ring-hydroxylating dioxygenase subunit beta [Herbaspirillum sp.]|jgi:benzoate/toluate 1,2-dioxygenase beta subunit